LSEYAARAVDSQAIGAKHECSLVSIDEYFRHAVAATQGREESYKTTIIEGSAAALELVTGDVFSVVVSDLYMPRIDGIDFLSRVRDLSPATSRILLSSDVMPEDEQRLTDALESGLIWQNLTKETSYDEVDLAIWKASVKQLGEKHTPLICNNSEV
jgi:CheY-like chemotaxis protein